MKNNLSIPDLLWLLLALICLTLIVYGLNKALKKTEWVKQKKQKLVFGTAIIILLWTILLAILSYKGFFADFGKLPPRPALAVLIPLPFVLLFAFSKNGTQVLQSIPPHWLIFMQSFRIFVELLIWLAFLANKLPVQMSFEGRNFDVLTGILSLPVGYLLLKQSTYSSKIIIAFNTIGILLLLNILIIAVLSMPGPARYFMNEPANTLVAQFPFIVLPGILVPIAYSFHIFSLRRLFISK
jgi:uncharacterized membrane protein